MNEIKINTENRMKKAIEALHKELTKLRTGRANPGLLENIRIVQYNQEMPLSQLASINASDARSLVVSPWDKTLVSAIENAIRKANLGLNPITTGHTIRVNIPALTEERRKELVKLVKNEAEEARVSIRAARRDANTQYKDMLKQKTINEDQEFQAQEAMQKLTDKFINEIDKITENKEKDLLAI